MIKIKELAKFDWNASYEPCFRDARPPRFEALPVWVNRNGAAPSLEVLEALPLLKTIDYSFHYENMLDAAAFQPVITALQRGIGLQSLQEVDPTRCDLGRVIF